MAGKADIMGLSVDVVSIEEVCGELKQYLQNEYLNVIFLATIQTIEKSENNPEYRKLLESSDYLLPGEEAVLASCQQKDPEQEGIFKDFRCFMDISKRLEKEGAFAQTVYYIGKTKKETQMLVDYSSEMYPWLKAQGMYCEGMEEKDDLLVNEINAVSPDILVVALESPFQEEWVMKNSTKLNARLCIGAGGILDELLKKKEGNGKFTWLTEKWSLFFRKVRWNLFRKKAEQYQERRKKG